MKLLTIIRGVPGSGKSTLARALMAASPKPALHMEADMFFQGTDGVYRYIPRLVPVAHEWCQKAVRGAMKESFPTIIVSNTSTIRPRFEVYLDMAMEYGYQVQQIITFGNFDTIHPMPKETEKKFADQLRASLMHELQMGELLACHRPSIV